MNSNLSLGLLLSNFDEVAKLPAYRGIANNALGQAIWSAQRIVREREAQMVDGEGNQREVNLDLRNTLDELAKHRPAPDGLEGLRTTPQEDLTSYARIYWAAFQLCIPLATNPRDLPQSVVSRIEWLLERSGQALNKAGAPKGKLSPTEVLAFAARTQQAKSDREFWLRNAGEIAGLVNDAVDSISGDPDEVIDHLSGVQAHQLAIQAGIAITNALVQAEKGLARFPVTTTVGKRLSSDVAVYTAYIPKVEEFVNTLEDAYASDIAEAVMNGRNLRSTESIHEAYGAALDRLMERAMSQLTSEDRQQLEEVNWQRQSA